MVLTHRYGSKKSMFLRRGMFRERLLKIIETFREKGAVSPDSAMTLKELGLPPRFGRLMSRRLGQSGLIIEAVKGVPPVMHAIIII